MKEKIRELIGEGRTEEALQLLSQYENNAFLLLNQYNTGKKQFGMRLIDYDEWSRIQANVTYAALEFADKIQPDGGKTNPAHPPTSPIGAQTGVFISYNHKDNHTMRLVEGQLKASQINTFVDVKDLGAGENIADFIDKALKNNVFILSIVSANSLLSGWVNKELDAALLLNRLGASKWLPVRIDNACFDAQFYFNACNDIDAKIAEQKANMKKALDADLDTSPFEAELKRHRDLKANLGTTIESLKKVNVVDISGEMFDLGMTKVIKAIQGK